MNTKRARSNDAPAWALALAASVADLTLEVRGWRADQARRQAASTRDGPDALLVLLLKQVYRDRTFQVYEVMARSAELPELREALERAGAETGKKLGNLCDRVEGRDMGGAHIIRLGANSKGVIWRVMW